MPDGCRLPAKSAQLEGGLRAALLSYLRFCIPGIGDNPPLFLVSRINQPLQDAAPDEAVWSGSGKAFFAPRGENMIPDKAADLASMGERRHMARAFNDAQVAVGQYPCQHGAEPPRRGR